MSTHEKPTVNVRPVARVIVEHLDNGKTIFSDPENSSAFLVSDTTLTLREVQ